MNKAQGLLIYEIEESDSDETNSKEKENSPTSKQCQKQTQISQKGVLPPPLRTIKINPNKEGEECQKDSLNLKELRQNIFFYDDEDEGGSPDRFLQEETNRQFVSKQLNEPQVESQESFQNEDMQEDISNLKSEQNAQKIDIKKGPKPSYLINAKIDNLINSIIIPNYKICCDVVIESRMMGLFPKYQLYLHESKQFLLSSKKQFTSLASSYLISKNKNSIHKRDDNFVARVEGNFLGTEFYLYSQGKKGEFAEAKITYNKNILGSNGLRSMKVTKISPRTQNKQIYCLKTIEQKQEKSKLITGKTAEPKLIKGKYRLNFGGKAKIPSHKNFIIEVNQKQAILFAKQSQNRFILEVSYPFTLLQGFSVSLTSLDSKILVS